MERLLLAGAALLLSVLFAPVAHAALWCANPIWVHEWGVQSFGQSRAGHRTAGPSIPGYFHRVATSTRVSGSPVRHLPRDSGERALPVLHFYAAQSSTSIPLGLEVGFTQGQASHWFPQVDVLRSASVANGAAAQNARRRLLAQRASPNHGPLASDPTRQLNWHGLTLTPVPAHARASTQNAWVGTARGFGRALWANNRTESERFVFYEARTTERPALVLTRGPTHRPGRRHYIVRNRGGHAVHDVFVIHREPGGMFAFFAPSIPAGASAGFLLEAHRVAPSQWRASTRDRLSARIVDPDRSAPPATYSWSTQTCTMMRDPAQPVEHTSSHRLYPHEVELVLNVWHQQFFGRRGTTVLYREDTAYLDEVMPLSLYTDMHHFVRLHRMGLALVTDIALP